MKNSQRFFKLTLSAVFTATLVICSWITIPAPIPFTLQTLGVFCVCLVAGPLCGFLSLLAYLLLGLVGLPVFSSFGAGLAAFAGPTGGFLMGMLFIPAAYMLFSKIFGSKIKVAGLLVGLLLCYLTGALWYMCWVGEGSLMAVLLTAVLPFIIPDVLKLFVAFAISKRLKPALSRFGLDTDEKLSPKKIANRLIKPCEVLVFESVDSTNTVASNLASNGKQTPFMVLAEKQTAGRGRRGRSFFSEDGLYMTVVLPAEDLPENGVGLTAMVAVATSRAIEKLTGLSVGIKWVNDLYLNGRKICGILCEAVRDKETGTLTNVIIGIGINLNVREFPIELKDVAANLGATVNRNRLAAEIMNSLHEIVSGGDYVSEYKERSVLIGKEITYETNGETTTATVIDIDNEGGLVVDRDGKTDVLTSGEITVRLK